MSSLETKVADSMLHRAQKIKIAGETFTVAPPVMETLILVSEKISEMPKHEYNEKEMLFGALANAQHYRPVADAIAILILGANGLTKKTVKTIKETQVKQVEKEVKDKYLFGLISKKRVVVVDEPHSAMVKTEVEVDEMSRVSKLLRHNKSNREILELLKQLLEGLQVGDFFVLSSILKEINLMRQATTPALGR